MFDKANIFCYIYGLVRLTDLKKFFKHKITLFLALIFAFSAVLFACSAINLTGGPRVTDTVYGNGGTAVVKGDYLYFANAYIDYNNLESVNDNKYDKNSPYTNYGIYRTKLDASGKVVLNADGVPQNVEILSYNIGGYAYSGLYICGDYLYYSTPYTSSTSGSDSTLVKGLVRFDRVKLNGTEHQELYKTATYSSDSSFKVVYIDGTTYIVISNGNKDLIVVNCTTSNVSNSTFASSITSFAVYDQRNIVYNETTLDAHKYVYYTTKSADETHYMYKKPLTGEDAEQILQSTSEILIKAVKNGRVYYTLDGKLYSTVNGESDVKLYSHFSLNTSESATTNTISSYAILDDSFGANLDRGILCVFYDGTDYSFRIFNGYDNATTFTTLDVKVDDTTASVTLIATQNNDFYFKTKNGDNDSLYMAEFELFYNSNSRFELSNLKDTKLLQTVFSTTLNNMLDFDTERFFVFESVNDSDIKYLKMIMINEPPYTDDDGNYIGQYVGVKK